MKPDRWLAGRQHRGDQAPRPRVRPQPQQLVTVRNLSLFENVDYLGSYAAGINLTGNGNTVVRNMIRRTGRSGINVDSHFLVDDRMGASLIANDDGSTTPGSVSTPAGSTCAAGWT